MGVDLGVFPRIRVCTTCDRIIFTSELARLLGLHRFTIAAGAVRCCLHAVAGGFVDYRRRVLSATGDNIDFASLSFQVPMLRFSAAK